MNGWLEVAETLCRKWEGCRLLAYPDPATGADPWTIGYGATGPDIHKGVVWTREQAEADLAQRLMRIGSSLDALLKVSVTPNQKGALASLAYNIGLGALKSSTLLRLLNSGDTDGAANQFGVWVKAAGKTMPGLVSRRADERRTFLEAA